jgi:hypothetical protein
MLVTVYVTVTPVDDPVYQRLSLVPRAGCQDGLVRLRDEREVWLAPETTVTVRPALSPGVLIATKTPAGP